jgi:endonuclease III
MANLIKEARLLANYVESLNYDDFEFIPPTPYHHIGALFTDIILQAGLNYRHVVRPRVARIFRLFPDATTVSTFEKLIQREGIEYVINWRSFIKCARISLLLEHCLQEKIEFEEDFKVYLINKKNQEKLLALNGIGPKTIDYALKLLCVDNIAVDRHIFNFISHAGIKNQSYKEVKVIVEYAADLLESSRMKLDTFIWRTMSSGSCAQRELF